MPCLSQPSLGLCCVPRHAGVHALVISCLLTVSPASAGPQFTVVHQFLSDRTDGGNPIEGLIVGPSGKLYGVTLLGGKNPLRCLINGSTTECGTVFELSAPRGGQTQYKEKPIHRFSGGDGFEPFTSLVSDSSGALYGATLSGSGNAKHCTMEKGFECGVVYKLTPPALGSSEWTETVLHRFKNAMALTLLLLLVSIGAIPFVPLVGSTLFAAIPLAIVIMTGVLVCLVRYVRLVRSVLN